MKYRREKAIVADLLKYSIPLMGLATTIQLLMFLYGCSINLMLIFGISPISALLLFVMCRSCGKCIFLQVTTIYVCCSSLFLTFEGTQENCIPINSNIRNQLGYAFGDVRWDIALFLFLLGFTLLTMLVMRQMELVKESNKKV